MKTTRRHLVTAPYLPHALYIWQGTLGNLLRKWRMVASFSWFANQSSSSHFLWVKVQPMMMLLMRGALKNPVVESMIQGGHLCSADT